MPLNSFPGGSVVKNSPALQEPQETWVPSLASGRSPRGGHGNPRPCSYLENPVDREAPWATVHGVTESDTMEVTWQARTHLPLDVPVMLHRECVSHRGAQDEKRQRHGRQADL